MTNSITPDVVHLPDGTHLALHSEIVRGEPRFYWAEHHRPGGRPSETLHGTGSYDKRTARRRMHREAKKLGAA